MSKKSRIAAALMLAVCLLISGAAATMHTEVENPVLEMTAKVGYDGIITYGKAFPVRVMIRNNGEDFEGNLGLNAYVSTKVYDRFEIPVSLPAGAEREYVLAPAVYSNQQTFTAEITKDGEIVCAVNAEPERVANPSAMLIGVLSSRPQNLNNLNIDKENDVLGRYEMWQTIALTPETFPEDQRLMNSFSMLVTDDFDPDALNGNQQKILQRWLYGGRILLCGGGAAGVRMIDFFSGDTGLRLAGMTSSDDVTGALQRSIGRAMSGEKVSVSLSELTGADPLVQDEEGRGLIWRTIAGGGRIYTAAFEAGDAALNAESLMHYYWQQLLVNNDADLYNTVLYSGTEDQGDMAASAGWSATVKARSGMLPALFITTGMLVIAGICWFGLKKAGRQKWMWLMLPLLSIATVLCLVLLSGASETNRPMAVIAENLVQEANGNIRSYRGITAATPEYGRHSYGMQGENLRVRNYDYVDFDEEETEKKPEPVNLRTCYTAGGENALSAMSTMPWEMVNMTCEADSGIQGQVETSIWMEEDGLHAEIVNSTEYRLTAGHVITNYGYVSVPDLDPGEKAEAALTHRKQADPQNPKYEDGGLYIDAGTDFYTMACAALGYTETYDSDRERDQNAARSSMINTAAAELDRQKKGYSYSSSEGTRFVFSAVPEGLPEIGLSVDGEPVSRISIVGQLTAQMDYLEIGRTGVVFRAAGMDLPVRIETDENGKPGKELPAAQQRVYYHALSETPAFRFDLGALKGVRIEKLRLTMESYYTDMARAYALNQATGTWDEIRMNEDIPEPDNYMDGEGRLFLQFRHKTQEMYSEIPTPMITLEGRLDNAAD